MIDRSQLPVPGPPRPFSFPAIDKSTLANGLDVWTVRHSEIPVVTLLLLVRCGAADDPQGQHGLAALTADMLDEGSGDRSAIDMHEALARIGAGIQTHLGSDAAVVGFTVLRRFVDRALALLADVAVRPALRDDDFSRVRQLRLHRLKQLRDVPGAIADRTFFKLLYGDHPYGHMPIGTEAALASLTVDDVRMFHAGAIRPSSTTLIAVGDCDHDEIRRLAGEAFATWEGQARVSNGGERSLPSSPRLAIVPRASAPQSELRIGQVVVARDTPDYHALVTANMVLGGQFISRINLNLREDKGVTYGARSNFDFRRRPGPFVLHVSVQTDATAQAIEESLGEIAAIGGSRPVTEDELALAASALTRGYARNFETAEQIARALTELALYNLPDSFFAEFVPRIHEVTSAEVTRVMASHMEPLRLTTVVVGDLDAVGADLGRLGLGDPVVLSAESFW
ncbi:MAG: hypothetical protein A3H95_12290 [Acidobacteria bacterium RIFCSPLOWO2_02_FULL_64_15]|nr:MAG: hypothetical protein A3H95_12290 [Acidobacteria bacterium RIFCSPLOWO2_02_FULL_64_15]